MRFSEHRQIRVEGVVRLPTCSVPKFLFAMMFFLLGLSGAASAEWMFDKAPTARGSSLETARHIPSDAQLVFGFALKGQLDVVGIARDWRAAARQDSRQRDLVKQMEGEIGLPLDRFLEMFSGRGFAVLLEPAPGEGWEDSAYLALELAQAEPFASWLWPRLTGDSKEQVTGDFRVRKVDGVSYGLSKSWFFIAAGSGAAQRAADGIAGGAVLAKEPTFMRAERSLTGGGSGAFVYGQGDGLRKGVFGLVELPPDHPATEELAFWDFGIFSLDLKTQRGDGFLGFRPEAGKLVAAMSRPGGVNAELVDLIPAEMSTLNVTDFRWLAGVLQQFGQDVNDFGLLLMLAQGQLDKYGSLDQAFEGSLAVGSNLIEAGAASLRQELYIETGDRRAFRTCRNNLSNLSSACETFATQHEGKYPESLAELAKDDSYYLGETPTCPKAEGKPYAYRTLRDSEDSAGFEIFCAGDHHGSVGVKPDHPRATSAYALDDGWSTPDGSEPVDPDRPRVPQELAHPSMLVVAPVRSVAEAHKIMANAVEANESTATDECSSNLKNIGTALEMWSTDNSGAYPGSLDKLVPDYLSSMPECPAAGADTYSGSYRMTPAGDGQEYGSYELHCAGHHHPELQANRPSYSSVGGLEQGPLDESKLARTRPVEPKDGERTTYTVKDGPTAVLDSGARVMRLGYGPLAQRYLEEGGGMASNRQVAEALQWGQSSIVYLDYMDLEPFYRSFEDAVHEARLAGEQEAGFLESVMSAARPHFGPLRGTSCLKVSDGGLHLRTDGIGSGAIFAAGALTFGIYLPNVMRSAVPNEGTEMEADSQE